MRRKFSLYIAIAAIFAVFLSLNAMIDFVADDFGMFRRISSFSDIPALALKTYYAWDGRLSAYLINHTILFLPKPVTVCVLALTATCLIVLACSLALGGRWKETLSWRHLLCAFCLVWLSVPAFGQAFFWRAGSPYGVLCFLSLLFLLPYRSLLDKQETSSWGLALCIPLGAFIGLGDYNTSVVLAVLAAGAGLFACMRDRRVRLLPFLSPVALLTGVYFAFTAPGNSKRLAVVYEPGHTGGLGRWDGIIEHLLNQPDVQSLYLWPWLLLLISLLLLWKLARLRREKTTDAQATVSLQGTSCTVHAAGRACAKPPCFCALAFFLAAQAAQAAFFFAPFAAKRAYTSSAVFMAIAALTLFFYVWPQCRTMVVNRWGKLYWTVAGTVFLVTLGNASVMIHANKIYYDACAEAAIAAAPGEVCFPQGPYRTDEYAFNGTNIHIGDDSTYWVNRGYAAYYGVESVRLCPQRFTLVPVDSGSVRFQGDVRNSVLHFSYAPSSEYKDNPFVFAFIKSPRNPVRYTVESAIEKYFEGFQLFHNLVAKSYNRAIPEIVSSHEGLAVGAAVMPHVEHTDRGYIVQYGEDGKTVEALVPLHIVRGE